MLHQAADGRGPATLLGHERDLAVYVSPPRQRRSKVRPLRDLRERQLYVVGSVQASFLLTLALLLVGTHGHYVRRCPDPECGKLFFNAKKSFCSTGHRMRVYMSYERKGKVDLYKRVFGRTAAKKTA